MQYMCKTKIEVFFSKFILCNDLAYKNSLQLNRFDKEITESALKLFNDVDGIFQKS